MKLLTDEEISQISLSAVTVKDATEDARAIEAAILAKLVSAELPEPSIFQYDAILAAPIKAYTADQLRQAYAQGAASQLAREPIAYMYQHDETGRIGFVESSQPMDMFKASNPRLQIVGPLYTRRQA